MTTLEHRFGHQSGLHGNSRQNPAAILNVFAFRINYCQRVTKVGTCAKFKSGVVFKINKRDRGRLGALIRLKESIYLYI